MNVTQIGQVMVERVDSEMIENYGVADLNGGEIEPFKSVSLKGLVEKPSYEDAPSDLAVLGQGSILPASALDILENVTAGVGGEIQLTDALDELIKQEGLNVLQTDASVFDCGSKQGLLGANLAIGMRDKETKRYLREVFGLSTYD